MLCEWRGALVRVVDGGGARYRPGRERPLGIFRCVFRWREEILLRRLPPHISERLPGLAAVIVRSHGVGVQSVSEWARVKPYMVTEVSSRLPCFVSPICSSSPEGDKGSASLPLAGSRIASGPCSLGYLCSISHQTKVFLRTKPIPRSSLISTHLEISAHMH